MVDGEKYALRAAEISMLAGVWLAGSGLLIAIGPLVWSDGTQRLGVHFPSWQVILFNLAGGVVAACLAAARAWSHQPPGIAWAVAVIGAVAVVVPFWAGAPQYIQVHNTLAGLALTAAAGLSAMLLAGPIGQPPPLGWRNLDGQS